MREQHHDAARVLAQHGDCLYRIALGILRQSADAEDAVQETMLRYLRRAPRFAELEHEKAWLITVTMNLCRDMLRRREKRSTLPLDAVAELAADEPCGELLALLTELPTQSRQIMLLHYIEGYSVEESARLLGIGLSAAKMRLKTGRERLKKLYQGGYLHESNNA